MVARAARVNDGPAIDAMGKPVSGDVRVKKGVSLDLGESMNEPQAEHSSRRERAEDAQRLCGGGGRASPQIIQGWV